MLKMAGNLLINISMIQNILQKQTFCFPYAKSIEDRKKMAEWLISKKNFEMSVVLDTIDDNLLKFTILGQLGCMLSMMEK